MIICVWAVRNEQAVSVYIFKNEFLFSKTVLYYIYMYVYIYILIHTYDIHMTWNHLLLFMCSRYKAIQWSLANLRELHLRKTDSLSEQPSDAHYFFTSYRAYDCPTIHIQMEDLIIMILFRSYAGIHNCCKLMNLIAIFLLRSHVLNSPLWTVAFTILQSPLWK